jgi:hypothetical protein
MSADLLPAIFTIDIGDTPTLTFEARNLREARELCREHWLKEDLEEAKSGGVLLWDGKAKLRARPALPDEAVLFVEAKNNGQPSDDLMLVYLVNLDSGTTGYPGSLIWSENNSQAGEIVASVRSLRLYGCRRKTIPLVVEVTGKAVAHCELRAIGFWMTVKGAIPIQPVASLSVARLSPNLIHSTFETSPLVSSISTGFEPASKPRPARSLIEMVLTPRSMKVCQRSG